MSETKLLHCPFCGGEAKVHSRCSYEETGGETMFFVRCNDCGSEGSWNYSKEKSIKAWNTRKTVERILERLEYLKDYELNHSCPKDGMCNEHNCGTCYTDTAIQIVKEEVQHD